MNTTTNIADRKRLQKVAALFAGYIKAYKDIVHSDEPETAQLTYKSLSGFNEALRQHRSIERTITKMLASEGTK